MNNLLPGFINSHPVTDDIRAEIAYKRQAIVNEIANAVLFESSYIAGQNLMIDGSMVVSE